MYILECTKYTVRVPEIVGSAWTAFFLLGYISSTRVPKHVEAGFENTRDAVRNFSGSRGLNRKRILRLLRYEHKKHPGLRFIN